MQRVALRGALGCSAVLELVDGRCVHSGFFYILFVVCGCFCSPQRMLRVDICAFLFGNMVHHI